MDTSTPGRRTRIHTGTILIDFEKAVMNAFSNSLPGWEVSNCFFHLCQAVQKNIQKKFKKIYFADKLFARASVIVDSEVRLLPAYPLGFWNHFARIIRDPEFPRTSNMARSSICSL